MRLRNTAVKDYTNGATDDLDDDIPEKTNHKVSKSKKKNSSLGRGRPRKALVPMYQSQISGDKNTIKIRIKKSNICEQEQVR